MFSGIIEDVGIVVSVRELEGAREFDIEAPLVGGELRPGDSISLDGACHTVVKSEESRFTVQTIGTTLSKTVARRYREGSRINLERSLAMGGRLDGHMVQGHVDGVGELVSVQERGDYWLMDFRVPTLVRDVTILHGSIAVNGISLTVSALPEEHVCQIGIIPYTWTHTNLSDLRPGDPVNLEGDLIGKYVGRILALRGWKGAGEVDVPPGAHSEG